MGPEFITALRAIRHAPRPVRTSLDPSGVTPRLPGLPSGPSALRHINQKHFRIYRRIHGSSQKMLLQFSARRRHPHPACTDFPYLCLKSFHALWHNPISSLRFSRARMDRETSATEGEGAKNRKRGYRNLSALCRLQCTPGIRSARNYALVLSVPYRVVSG